jgi:hypothetical protein
MDWLKKMTGRVWSLVPGALNLVGAVLTSLWDEIVDGHHRLSWWGLLGLVALAGGWLI